MHGTHTPHGSHRCSSLAATTHRQAALDAKLLGTAPPGSSARRAATVERSWLRTDQSDVLMLCFAGAALVFSIGFGFYLMHYLSSLDASGTSKEDL